MIRIDTKARLVCIAVTFLAPVAAQTGAWTPPVAISAGGQGWEAAAAIDADGNSVAIWEEITGESHIWSRSKPSAGNWGSVTQESGSVRQDSRPRYGPIRTAYGPPIARPLRNGIHLSFWSPARQVRFLL